MDLTLENWKDILHEQFKKEEKLHVESFWVFIEKLLLLQREKDIEVINSRFIQGGKTSPQSFNSGIASAVWAIRNQDEKAKITLQKP